MSETEIVVVNEKDEHKIEVKELTLLLHSEPMQIDVPDRFEINAHKTIEEVRNLSEVAWRHITTGEIFQYLFRVVYPLPDASNHTAPKEEVKIPDTVEQLLKGDMGIQHISGMIILAITQGGILGKKLFFRTPETYLHPKQQCQLADLFIVMPKIIEYMQNMDDDNIPTPPKPPMHNWLNPK